VTTNDPPRPRGRRRPRAVGNGHTGNPCGYPGCDDRNASLSVMWERPDQDHDFGGTNRELRCREHWGMEEPRMLPQGRRLAPLDKDVLPEQKPHQTVSGGLFSHLLSRPVSQIDISMLWNLCREMRYLVKRDPGEVLNVCRWVLEREQRFLKKDKSPEMWNQVHDFWHLQHWAKEEIQRQDRNVPDTSVGAQRTSVSKPGGVGAPKAGKRMSASKENKSKRPLELKKRTTESNSPGAGGQLTSSVMDTLFSKVEGLVQRNPQDAVATCDQMLENFGSLKRMSGGEMERQRWLDLRERALNEIVRSSP